MNAQQILKHYWGYDAFRPLQEEIVHSVLAQKDTLALLPTGGGKSLCFQVPAMMMEGICIVVSPLIALMKDQVENLKDRGIKAMAIYSGMGKREIDIALDNCIYGNFKFLYLSPERLLSELVRVRISYMNVNLIAIDEAHCISQWGYDFRPPYLQIAKLRALHPKVPMIALTATATQQVREDIVLKLEFKKPNIYVKSFSRANLSYVVFNLDDKHKKLLTIAHRLKGCGLVYVRNRRETAEVAQFLLRNGISADYYHAGLDKEIRFKRQEDWKQNRTRIMVATNAFGMGIDKSDVRFVVHLDLPESLEAYYQEAGRAGRDEKKAYTVLLTNQSDIEFLKLKFEDKFPEIEEIKKIYHHLGNYFQLAYGVGEGLNFEFDITDFCKRFNIKVLRALSAFKFLEKDGYVLLSESIYIPSRLMFVASNEDVYRFQIENKLYDQIIKTIQRSYGGAFDSYVKINEGELCSRLRMSYQDLIKHLKYLDDMQIISYQAQTDKPQLQFISPRVDLQHLSIDAGFIDFRKQIHRHQIETVVKYSQDKICRSVQLLTYFDEKNAVKCGTCDVCIEEKKNTNLNEYQDRIEFEIMTVLQKSHLDIDNLVSNVKTGNDHDKIEQIRILLDAGKIKSDGSKYYL